MLVYKQGKAVIYKLADPSRITSVIPDAKVKHVEGGALVSVRHRPDEVAVLRNLGFTAPDPMNIYYEYRGKFTPFEAQKETAQFASMNRRCFILNSMGLGKTISSLWAVDYLKSIGYVHKVLIVCPLSVMERAWSDEIFRSFPTSKINVLYGARARRLKLLAEDADFYIINIDGVKIIEEAMADRPDIDLVIIDELAQFRTAGTARWKAANAICNKQCNGSRRVWGLTGSPIPNSPCDAFGQIKLVTPFAEGCPKYFMRFKQMVMTQLNQFRWLPKPDAVETVFRIMRPAIRYNIADVVDLPPQIVVQRKVELEPEQRKAFTSMFSKLCAEAEGGTILAVNEAVKASKLLQICCGVAYSDAGNEVELPCVERLDAASSVVEESEGKTIVFVPFTAALNRVATYLAGKAKRDSDDQTRRVVIVDGSTAKADRDEIFHEFQNAPKGLGIDVIVANPAAISHGVTLTAATTICWYGPCYSNETYQQACARIYRTGQTRSTVVVQLVSSAVEEKVYERLADKQSTQGLLLELVKTLRGAV